MKKGTFLFDVREGLRYGIPICCIVQFCFDVFLGRMAGYRRATTSPRRYTPCSIHRKIDMRRGFERMWFDVPGGFTARGYSVIVPSKDIGRKLSLRHGYVMRSRSS